MLTKISIVTGVAVAAANLAALFGLNVSTDQLAGISVFVAAVGGAVHAWFNPDVPFGDQGGG